MTLLCTLTDLDKLLPPVCFGFIDLSSSSSITSFIPRAAQSVISMFSSSLLMRLILLLSSLAMGHLGIANASLSDEEEMLMCS
ncbi:hypothetical protein Chor_004184 [Crotalus horridus]